MVHNPIVNHGLFNKFVFYLFVRSHFQMSMQKKALKRTKYRHILSMNAKMNHSYYHRYC